MGEFALPKNSNISKNGIKHKAPEGAKNVKTFKIYRWDPDGGANPRTEAPLLNARLRKAWLKGLSLKENRDVPPLDYALVRRLKRERPHLNISINGGIGSLEETEAHLGAHEDLGDLRLDGVMLGRAAYHEPALLGQVDRRVFGADAPDVSPFEAVEAYEPYLAARLAEGVALHAMTRHMLGLMHGRAAGGLSLRA
jgi:tRNA dihydrouridine synthase A